MRQRLQTLPCPPPPPFLGGPAEGSPIESPPFRENYARHDHRARSAMRGWTPRAEVRSSLQTALVCWAVATLIQHAHHPLPHMTSLLDSIRNVGLYAEHTYRA